MGKPKYRSQFEERVCNNLRNRNIKFAYEPYSMNYTTEVRSAICPKCGNHGMLKVRTYTPDLELGNGVIVELKGKFTGEMRTKMLAVKWCNPQKEIKILFQKDNWCTKNQKMRYSDWCKRHAFDYAIGEVIPDEWT